VASRRYIYHGFVLLFLTATTVFSQTPARLAPSSNTVLSSHTTLAQLIIEIRSRAKTLENTSGMRSSFSILYQGLQDCAFDH